MLTLLFKQSQQNNGQHKNFRMGCGALQGFFAMYIEYAVQCCGPWVQYLFFACSTLCLHRVIVIQKQWYAVVLVIMILIGVIS